MSQMTNDDFPARPRRQRNRGWLLGAVVGFGLMMVSGCGDSTSEESPVVSPPDRTATDPAVATPDQQDDAAPGGLEMPAIEITDGSGDTPDSGQQGGLELPTGVPIPAPETNDSDAAPTGDQSSNIEFGSWEEIQALVTTSGKITVVDLWSLHCEPCKKEFPGLVRLHESLGETIECVAVDIDYDGRKSRPPEYYQPQVTEFVQSNDAKFTTYICSTPSEEVYAATELDSIPAVLIYDAQGQIVKVFADAGETIGFTYDKDIIPLVTKLAG